MLKNKKNKSFLSKKIKNKKSANPREKVRANCQIIYFFLMNI